MEAPATPAAAKKRPHPLPWLNLLATEPFYLLHLFAFFSYFVARSSAAELLSSPELRHRLLRREIQAMLAFLVLAVVKMVKQESWEAFVDDIIFYAKGFLFAVALLIDYHLAFCYLVVFLVIFVLSQQPACDDLGDSSQLTPLQLETLLTEGSTSRFWLVEFRNQFSSRCVRTSRFLSELSITYSNKNISFGIVDLGHFPNAAEKFGISLGGVLGTYQLPTYILFDHAEEVTRFPQFTFDSKASPPKITKNILCRHFELDQRLIDYVSDSLGNKVNIFKGVVFNRLQHSPPQACLDSPLAGYIDAMQAMSSRIFPPAVT